MIATEAESLGRALPQPLILDQFMTRSRQSPIIIAVDGPAGSGKSSLCHAVAQRLGWTYLNTGALYRAIGFLALEAGIPLNDGPAVAVLVAQVTPDLKWQGETQELWCQDRNLMPFLGSQATGEAASQIASLKELRAALLPLQRHLSLSAPRGVLVDGRDIGTVVFPDASLKVFLTASLEARAQRRLQQLEPGGGAPQEAALKSLMGEISLRDARDANRDVAPMRQAVDAVPMDTSHLNFDESVATFIRLLKDRGLLE